jgi:plasmid replication initiation protein
VAKSNRNLVVSRKPNKIIEARQSLSAVQHKILFSIFSQFRTKVANTQIKTTVDFANFVMTTYSVKLSDIIPELKKQKAGVDSALYKHIDKEVSDIMKQVHEVRTEDRWEKYNVVDTAIFHKMECRLEIRIAVGMMMQLMKMFADGYTRISMKEIIPLRSKYSIKIFELLLSKMNIQGVKENGYTISYENLRESFKMGKELHKEFYNFKAYVLEQAYREINEKTFMRFEYRVVYEKRQVKNICFFNITHNIKETLPQQLELFDFDKIEAEEDERIKEIATIDFKHMGKERITTIKKKTDEKCFATSEKFAEERRESELWAMQSSIDMKYTAEDIKKMQDNPRGFTEEQLKKLDVYLDGIFSANEVKRDYDFDYIEFYYKKTMRKHEVGGVDDFAGFLYNLIKKDSYKFYELKTKEEQERKEKAEREKIEITRRKEEQKQAQIKKEKEAADIKRRIELFNSLDDNQKEKYLKEFYATNQFYKDVIDKDGISDFTKISIGQLLEK